ncbi:hypothetical protein GN244_ATG18701 [Phytophthora infestans]|uniref:RxLR effector PexRD54 WY domain-containing protein n=1 Tax=Phytophthora infestans TaxID=4787 RepID=A0A833SWA0_PHYIN|nr:hypothetical protein GN244_ATG18701 [Phytophthora infestans]KAF4138960.1 hypothetical protein GN958_ATG11917 [Phytophthora infestans]
MRPLYVVVLVVAALPAVNAGAHTNYQRTIATGWQEVPSSLHELTTDTLSTDNSVHESRDTTRSAVEMFRNALKSSVPDSQLEMWFKHAVSTDDALKLFLRDNAADDLLTVWLSYMKRFYNAELAKKTSLIATLTAHYGDDGMAKLIETAKQMPSTAKTARRLESELTQLWLGRKKSVDDVFKLLKLDETGDQLFTQPQIVAWAKYVDDFNKANPDKHVTLFSYLKGLYTQEETLVKMLITAKKSPMTEKIAVRIQAEQSKNWLSNKKSPGVIFTLLNLNEDGISLVKSPLFQSWVKYTDEFNMVNPENTVAVISVLKAHYSDDVLARMSLSADKTPSTQSVANLLRSELQREWYATLKSGDVVFKTLKLDKSGSKVFERSLFPLWKDYMQFVSLKDPRIKVSYITPLIKVYGEKKLAQILIAAEKVPSTKKFATELLDKLFYRWLDERKSPTLVFSLLRVDGAAKHDASSLIYKKYAEAFAGLP